MRKSRSRHATRKKIGHGHGHGYTKNKTNGKGKSHRRGTSRRIPRRRRRYTKKRRVLYGASNIDTGVEAAINRLRENDPEWYDKNVVPAQERAANRQLERQRDEDLRQAQSLLPASISRMGDPELMAQHTRTMDLADARQTRLQQNEEIIRLMREQQQEEHLQRQREIYRVPMNTDAGRETFELAGLDVIDDNELYSSAPPAKRARLSKDSGSSRPRKKSKP